MLELVILLLWGCVIGAVETSGALLLTHWGKHLSEWYLIWNPFLVALMVFVFELFNRLRRRVKR